MKKLIATLLIVLGAYACAEDAKADEPLNHAITGQLADVGTTAIGLAAGFAEANPLGVALLPLKAGIVYVANQTEDPVERCEQLRTIGNAGYAPAVANLVTIATGATLPVSIVVLLATFITLQHTTADNCK